MAELVCEQVREVGAELALGVLSGRDRARAIAHLQDCPACEQYVRELSVVGDKLLTLVPGAEPPVGFEQRVLDRLGIGHRRRWRRRWLAAAAVLLAIGLASGGWVLHGALHAEHELATAAITAGSQPVGQAFAYTDRQSWLWVEFSSPTASGMVSCQAILEDGRTVPIGWFPITAGSGQWAGTAPLDGLRVVELRILASDGSLLGTAHFG